MAENNTNYDKHDDNDVLRAQDIVPPFNTQKNRGQPLKKTTSSLNADQTQQIEGGTSESSDIVQRVSEIPKFDLAEQILAEQRKITAIRRKAPGRKQKIPDNQLPAQSTGYVSELLVRALPEKDLIITEIVARDIEKIYRDAKSNIKDW